MKHKKTVFITGASGRMGHEGFKQLMLRRDRFNIVALVLPTKKDRLKMKRFEKEHGVKIIWGDLTNYDDVYRCVNKADYILHVGGMVSPEADYYPELTYKVNVGAVTNIIKAIKAQPDPDNIKFVFIGSIAETGDRNPPIHWGRTGDPIKISKYDYYAITKTIAERMVIESGLKYWVSLRQTGILYPELINTFDPIMFHVPIDGVFEWITAKDSGVLLTNVCDDNIHEDFWRRIYNIGGGKGYRITNYEFMKKCYEALDVNDFTLYTNLNWFATGNFHGQWYTDSDILEDYFHFRTGTIDDFIKEIKNNLSIISRITKYIPSFIIKKFAMKPLANRELGTMNWINNNKKEHINAYYGSKKKWEEIPNWKNYLPTEPDPTPVRLNHGYNENKPVSELNLNDICEAAVFRGGKCMSDKMKEGDLFTKLKWKCAFDHEFEASPALVLLGGHWCPHCLPAPWNYDEEAKRNPFFAQVWDPLHH